MLLDNLLVKAVVIADTLSPLYSFNIFGEFALGFTGPPNRQVAFKDVIDLFQGTSSSFGVGEEDVEGHRRA